jgi:hypothetical protein
VPRVVASPPDAMRGRYLKFGDAEARVWLDDELDQAFPKAEAMVQKMQLDVHYKDVTFETLNKQDFLDAVQKAFPRVNWEKAYEGFRAAGEKESRDAPLVRRLNEDHSNDRRHTGRFDPIATPPVSGRYLRI